MHSVDTIIGVGEASTSMVIVGNCDLVISGLSAGAVKLQYKLPKTAVLTVPAWTDFPDGSFTEDVYKTIFISEHGVEMRCLGVANNAGVYIRFARYLNK